MAQKDGTGSSGGSGRLLEELRRLLRRRAAGPGKAAPGAPRPGQGQAVLIVDLNGPLSPTLAQQLRRSGFTTQVVGGQAAALDALERARPALVVVVGPAGLELYGALRRATPALILALDSRANDEQMLAAFDAGVDQFKVGPLGSAEAVAWILALLRRTA